MTRGRFVLLASILGLCALAGCFDNSGLKAGQQTLAKQQAEIDQLKSQIAALRAQRPAYSTVPLPPGSCDQTILREARRKGGERFAAGDFTNAIGYYSDAVAACPNNAVAQLDLARSYEAAGDNPNAIKHYTAAADTPGPNADPDAARQAREALIRLGEDERDLR